MTAESTVPEDHQSLLDPTFTVVRRGFDQSEVRRTLVGLAGDLRAARERELLLARQLAEAERRAEAVDPLDPSHLTKLLGDEVARILDAARAAAAQIRARADEAATRLFEETKAEAAADAAAVIERAELEAREILRLAQERTGDPSGDPSGDPVGGPSVDPVGEIVIGAGHDERPRPPTQQRSGRSGVDRDRTAGLFAALREHRATEPAPGPARPRPTTQMPTNAPPASPDAPVGVSVGVSVSADLSRVIRRTLTDDLNALLAEFAGSKGRGRSLMVRLDPGVGPTVADHAARLMDTLEEVSPPIDRSTAQNLADSLAEAIVVPLRARLDEILADSQDHPDGVPTQLRGCFRQFRSEFVEPAVRSVLMSMEH